MWGPQLQNGVAPLWGRLARMGIRRQYLAGDVMRLACRIMNHNQALGSVLYRVALRTYYRNGGAA
jgi:hypothetical protein